MQRPSSLQTFDSLLLPSNILHRKLRLVEPRINQKGIATSDTSNISGEGQHEVPPEKMGNMFSGLLVHLGPVFALAALLILNGNTMPSILMWGLGVMVATMSTIVLHEQLWPAAALPNLKAEDVVRGTVLVFITGVLAGSSVVWLSYQAVLWLQIRFFYPDGVLPSRQFDWWYITYATLLDDYMYYFYHRFLSHGAMAFFQKVHMPHHAVECLDFWRGNLSSVWDTAIFGFQLWYGPIAAMYGMSLEAVFVSYFMVLLLQATHHTNHTFNIGKLRFFFVDNHAHKMHHCPWYPFPPQLFYPFLLPFDILRGSHLNLGACFSMWDRNCGTYYEDTSICTNYAQLHKVHLNVRPLSRSQGQQDINSVLVMALIFSMFFVPAVLPPATACCILVATSCLLAMVLPFFSTSSKRD